MDIWKNLKLNTNRRKKIKYIKIIKMTTLKKELFQVTFDFKNLLILTN